MPKSLNDFPGHEAIFIDVNIFLHHAFDSNDEAGRFLNRIETSGLRAFTSALVLEEVTFKLLMQSASNVLKHVTVERVKFLLRNRRVREKVLKPVREYRMYINTLKDFGLTVLDLTDGDMVEALKITSKHGLISADAAHVAVMERKEITHIATGDADFSGVPPLNVWSP